MTTTRYARNSASSHYRGFALVARPSTGGLDLLVNSDKLATKQGISEWQGIRLLKQVVDQLLASS